MYDDVKTAVAADFAQTRAQLEQLVRVPSVSAPGFDANEVQKSADLVAELLTGVGLENVRLLEIEGAHPAVYGEKQGPVGAPTVLLYAHHDVQPPGPAKIWERIRSSQQKRRGASMGGVPPTTSAASPSTSRRCAFLGLTCQ